MMDLPTFLPMPRNRPAETCKGPSRCQRQALQGKADTREVVDAVMSAEQTLQAAIAITGQDRNCLSGNQPNGHLRNRV